jgi:hypothetical protein
MAPPLKFEAVAPVDSVVPEILKISSAPCIQYSIFKSIRIISCGTYYGVGGTLI